MKTFYFIWHYYGHWCVLYTVHVYRMYITFRLCILWLSSWIPSVCFSQGLSFLQTVYSAIASVSMNSIWVFSGSISPSDFVTTTMSVLEGISQHPQLVADFHQVVLESILPIIADLVVSQNGKTSEIEKSIWLLFQFDLKEIFFFWEKICTVVHK